MSCLSFIRKKHSVKLKAFKVQDVSGNRKYGIASSSLEDFINKASRKLGINPETASVVLAEDGTEIDDDDYFELLPYNVSLVLLDNKETWTPQSNFDPHKLKLLLGRLLAEESQVKKNEVKKQIAMAIRDEDNRELQSLMGKIVTILSEKAKLSTRQDDPDWFKGEARFHTKEQYMSDRAKARVRGYLSEAKTFIKQNTDKTTAKVLEETIKAFEEQLKRNKYFGDYFDRSSTVTDIRMCDTTGLFACEGRFDEPRCTCEAFDKPHTINPYASLGNRLVFQNWNLDHGVEKSREVLPQLRNAAQQVKHGNKRINVDYFFGLLFTRKNLKLVHISCHDKKVHASAKCDQKKIFLAS